MADYCGIRPKLQVREGGREGEIKKYVYSSLYYIALLTPPSLPPSLPPSFPYLEPTGQDSQGFYPGRRSLFFSEGGREGGREGGMEGIINCVGIESPGLTASLAIAEWVKRRAMG